MESKQFHSKIVGSTFTAYGQRIINELKPNDILILKREPENKFDTNAIMVNAIIDNDVFKLERIGYIPKDTAMSLAKDMDEGIEVSCIVSEITGKDKNNIGCNILITINPK